jgi:outer membrane protein OmpA-like peptidoglycan-associated protein
MMKANISKTLAIATLLAGGASAAYATEGWYGRVDAGYSFEGSIDYEGIEAEMENDWVESLGLGYAFQNGLRLEGEVAHRYNETAVDLGIFGTGDGDAHAWSAMGNVYYDFNHGGAVQPYVGLGVGAARLNVNQFFFLALVDDQETSFAYQGMAGLAFAVTDQLTLDVGYRYFATEGAELDGISIGGPFTVDADYEHQSVMLGLRWQFAGAAPPPPPPPPVEAPPPPPPPAPPPVACPTADFVVYFEWDRSNLNQAALETIDTAVARARACNLSGVTVVGHTDTSGAAQYNLGLSERRAGVVADALTARGIPATAIARSARGETELARATRDGVREPLNRRAAVTITFQP